MKYAPCHFCGKTERGEPDRVRKDVCELCRKIVDDFEAQFAKLDLPRKPE